MGDVQVHGGAALDGALRLELQRALTVADRANNAVLQEHDGRWIVQGDPTEGALLVAARKAGSDGRSTRRALRAGRRGAVLLRAKIDDDDSHRRRARRNELLVFTKGAPDVLLARCVLGTCRRKQAPFERWRREEILQTNEKLAGDALRTLGVAGRALPRTRLIDEEVDEHLEQELVFPRIDRHDRSAP